MWRGPLLYALPSTARFRDCCATLAAELGQIAFERGASYDTLFVASLITVALGCVGLASLPGDGKATSPNASPKTTTRQNAALAVVRDAPRDVRALASSRGPDPPKVSAELVRKVA